MKKNIQELNFTSKLQIAGLFCLLAIFFAKATFKDAFKNPNDKV